MLSQRYVKERYNKLLNINSNSVASSYYGVSNVGAALRQNKYENGGDFPDFLLKLALKAFRSQFGQEQFDYILYVPPTESGELVKNYAEKLSQVLKIRFHTS
ncbi:hypothetical protein [Proteiniphilum sp.]|uniref:hypothetical protein n=1 Tax=Proteiniphilum sp. TaxID=1926877 RepID=UPI0033194D72